MLDITSSVSRRRRRWDCCGCLKVTPTTSKKREHEETDGDSCNECEDLVHAPDRDISSHHHQQLRILLSSTPRARRHTRRHVRHIVSSQTTFTYLYGYYTNQQRQQQRMTEKNTQKKNPQKKPGLSVSRSVVAHGQINPSSGLTEGKKTTSGPGKKQKTTTKF